MKKPSDKQEVFAIWISKVTNKPLPTEYTAQAYFLYIQENIEQYQELKSKQIHQYHQTRKHIYDSVMDKGEDAEWAAAMDFSWM